MRERAIFFREGASEGEGGRDLGREVGSKRTSPIASERGGGM